MTCPRGTDERYVSTYSHEVEVVQGVGAGLGTAQADHNNTDQRGNRKHIRREDTRDAAGFAHGGWIDFGWLSIGEMGGREGDDRKVG